MAAIPYDPNIPQATDQISVSQGEILINFTGINAWTAVDHFDFASADAGYHNQVSLIANSANTIPAGTPGLYSKNYGVTSKVEIWDSVNQASGTQTYPFTSSIFSTVAAPVNNSSGWSYFPSGLIMKWGATTVPMASTPIPLNGLGPNFTNTFSATAVVQGTVAGTAWVVNLIPATLTLNNTINSSVYWVVIGW